MATSVETIPVSTTAKATRRDSQASLPPNYDSIQDLPATPTSSSASLPHYDDVADKSSSSSSGDPSGFLATRQLQIQASGIPVVRFPTPPRNVPIYVFGVTPSGDCDSAEYVSVRPSRESGSCFLARADDPEHTPLSRTTYRFGPGKPPKIQLLGGSGRPVSPGMQPLLLEGESEETLPGYAEEFAFEGAGPFTRTHKMRTSLGTFEWRYAGKAERAAAEADSLLVMDRLTSVALEGGKTEVRRRKVAQLVRSKATRTAGTTRSYAGNGGRLMLDLRELADTKGEAAQLETLAVSTCITMLKKEVDRRRLHQTIVIIAAASS